MAKRVKWSPSYSQKGRTMKTSILAAAIGLAFSSGAFAQAGAGTIQRDVNQQQRIEQGVQSGSLTTREAGRLERGEAQVSRQEARAGVDGNVSAKEQQRVQSAENRQSKRIYRQKHDGQKK